MPRVVDNVAGSPSASASPTVAQAHINNVSANARTHIIATIRLDAAECTSSHNSQSRGGQEAVTACSTWRVLAASLPCEASGAVTFNLQTAAGCMLHCYVVAANTL